MWYNAHVMALGTIVIPASVLPVSFMNNQNILSINQNDWPKVWKIAIKKPMAPACTLTFFEKVE